ncbi:MAG TPA: hypothetical protein VNE61_08915 [Ktedonobacteraceae bacterium]|nr:hypothetical protein [Ktedonobacteraceae bacterium]
MDITVAYFHPLLHPDAVKRDFEQIRATGAGSIVCAVHEQETQRWPRDLERGFRLAQDMGLKVYLSLGRYGNLLAGPALIPSWYTFQHPHSRVMDRHGRYHDISCFNHQSFRSWLFGEIEQYLQAFPINGIVIDEPRGIEITCFCSVCRALCPDVTDLPRFHRRSFIDFLGEMCATVKRVDTYAKTTIVLLPQDLDLVEDLVALAQLDTIGCHLFWQLLQEDVAMIEIWSRSIVQAARRQEKRSQLWLQNFHLNKDDEQALESAFIHLQSAEPDEIGCYYYWRNNERPTEVWQKTHELLRRIPRRQLFWRAHAAAEGKL